MKKVSINEAVGLTLCHDVTAVRDGFKGVAFKRGRVITAEDVPALLDIGKRTVFVWEENAGELHEDDCALRLAAMAPVSGAHYTEPSEGKTTLVADRRGLFRVDAALLRELNSIEDVTISSLPDHYPVEKGERIASMRIVPLVTREERIEAAERLCAGKKLFELREYTHKKAAVIITGSEVYSGRIKDKFEPVVRAKLSRYPCEVLSVSVCDDDLEMIVGAAQSAIAAGAELLIFTGGMSVDPDDLTPAAIRRLGACVISHGVPAQPGNMTLVAYLGELAILGVPSSAIKQPVTVFDVLLPQLFTGDRLTKGDLVRLGEGGLCRQCGSCHYPNCVFGRY